MNVMKRFVTNDHVGVQLEFDAVARCMSPRPPRPAVMFGAPEQSVFAARPRPCRGLLAASKAFARVWAVNIELTQSHGYDALVKYFFCEQRAPRPSVR